MSTGIQIKLEAFGFPQVEAAIRGILLKAGHLKVPFEVAGRFLITRTHEHFEHERRAEGEPWKSLSAAYIVRPKKQGGRGGLAHPVLHVHGYLEQSITHAADDTALAVGKNPKFPGGETSAAAIHQVDGAAELGAKIPAQPFLGMNDTDAERVSEFLREYLAKL
jgi:phage gpG-like protein